MPPKRRELEPAPQPQPAPEPEPQPAPPAEQRTPFSKRTSSMPRSRRWTVRRVNDLTGGAPRTRLEYSQGAVKLSRASKKKGGAAEPAESVAFSEVNAIMFGPSVMTLPSRTKQIRRTAMGLDPWCCFSFLAADTTYDLVAEDGRAAREGARTHAFRACGSLTLCVRGAAFSALCERAGLPGGSRGSLLWHNARLRLQVAPPGGLWRPLRDVLRQTAEDQRRWADAAGGAGELRLVAMSTQERGKLFTRFDRESSAPFEPRGLLTFEQSRQCLLESNALDLEGGAGAPIPLAAVEAPCWQWAFAAAGPEASPQPGPAGVKGAGSQALNDHGFRKFLEFVSYYHQSWPRFGLLAKPFGELSQDQALSPYAVSHACAILLGATPTHLRAP